MVASTEVSERNRGTQSLEEADFFVPPSRDPLYLFGCHLLWHCERNLKAYQELVAALDDRNPEIRAVAESLLRRRFAMPEAQGNAQT